MKEAKETPSEQQQQKQQYNDNNNDGAGGQIASQPCGVDSTGEPTKRSTDHIPVAIVVVTDAELNATQNCRVCQRRHRMDKQTSNSLEVAVRRRGSVLF